MSEVNNSTYFPLFVNLDGKRATIIGGGDTACRKAKMLLKFGAEVRLISPEIQAETEELVRGGSLKWLKSEFSAELLEGTDLLVAATNVRGVNHAVYEAAKAQRILCSVCDSREESSFIFPVVVRNEVVVAGITTIEDDSLSIKRLVQKIREKFGTLH